MESPEAASTDAQGGGGGLPPSLMFGVGESDGTPLPAAEGASNAPAAPQQPQPPTEQTSVPPHAGSSAEPQATQGAQPAPEAGAPEAPQTVQQADPELSEADNALAQSLPESERPAFTDRAKAASFWGQLNDRGKPIEDVRSYFENKNPTRYGELEKSVVSRAVSDPARLVALYKADPEAYGRLARTAFDNDPDYFLRLGTGREDLTFDALKSLPVGDPGNAASLTDEEIEDVNDVFPAIAEKLTRAREAAAKTAAQSEPADRDAAQGKQPDPSQDALKPETVIERFETLRQRENETFEHGTAPVHAYVGKLLDEKVGKAPTEQEQSLTPEVAALKAVKRELFLRGLGETLPGFEDGLGKWGQHRKLQGREFDEITGRLGRFARDGVKEGAASVGRELLPFADAYFNERLAHPVFKLIDNLIALAAGAANPPVRREAAIPGGQNSQPASSTPASGDAWLLQHAAQHS